jgi:hypothetical protein
MPEKQPKKGLSFISNRQRRNEGTFCASELAGIEPTPPAPKGAGYIRLDHSATVGIKTNSPEHTIVPSILTDLIFKKKERKKSSIVGPTIEPAKQPSSSNEFQKSKLTHISSSTPTQSLILDSYKLNTKTMSLIH